MDAKVKTSVQKIFRVVIAVLAVLMVISLLLPIATSKRGDEVEKLYLYVNIFETYYIFIFSFLSLFIIGLTFGALLPFSRFKNKDIIAAGLIFLSCLSTILLCLSLSKELIVTDYITEKKAAGYYFLMILSCAQILATLAYLIVPHLPIGTKIPNSENYYGGNDNSTY